MRPVYDQRVATLLEPFVTVSLDWCPDFIMDSHRVYRLPGHSRDVVHWNAGIDDCLVVPIKINSVDRLGSSVNVFGLFCPNTMTPRIPLAKIPRSHESESADA